MIPVVIKPYLCWTLGKLATQTFRVANFPSGRAPDADAELFTDLFHYDYHEGMHKRAFGKTKDKWEKFTEDLFATQQGFIGKDKITVKTLHSWKDGRCKNLSGLT